MKNVLMAVLIYLALITVIFYIIGYIIGTKFDARRKITQRAKELFETEKTFKEALEVYPKMLRKRYHKVCLRQDALLIIVTLALMIAVVSIHNEMSNWDAFTSRMVIFVSVIDAVIMFLMAYKGAEYVDNYYEDEEDGEYEDEILEEEKMKWYDIAGKWINDDDCNAIDVVEITKDCTFAYARNKEGRIITVSYLNAGNLSDGEGRLNLDDELMKDIRQIKEDIMFRVKKTGSD